MLPGEIHHPVGRHVALRLRICSHRRRQVAQLHSCTRVFGQNICAKNSRLGSPGALGCPSRAGAGDHRETWHEKPKRTDRSPRDVALNPLVDEIVLAKLRVTVGLLYLLE